MIVQWMTMVDATFPFHSQTGVCVYKETKALQSDGKPYGDGLRVSLISCSKNPGGTVLLPHDIKQKSPILSLLLYICGLHWTDCWHPFKNVLQQLENLPLRLRAKCRRCDLHIWVERPKLEFKTNLIKRGANSITFRDLCHKFVPDDNVELATRESVLLRSQVSD